MQKNTFIVEGIDRLGKSTLIGGIKNALGYHQVIHFQKPESLDFYKKNSIDERRAYQSQSFRQLMWIIVAAGLTDDSSVKFIFDRSHIGEAVYAKKYRGYSGEYVFDLEKEYSIDLAKKHRMILLIEDFDKSTHYVDDGKSLGSGSIVQRVAEQQLFLTAFHKSIIQDKKIICVTDDDGTFKNKNKILKEALE